MTSKPFDPDDIGRDALWGCALGAVCLAAGTLLFDVSIVRAGSFSVGFNVTCLAGGGASWCWLRTGSRKCRAATVLSLPLLTGWAWVFYRFVEGRPPVES